MSRFMIFVLLLTLATVAMAQQPPAEITAAIRLNGYTVDPADITLRASPVNLSVWHAKRQNQTSRPDGNSHNGNSPREIVSCHS